MELKKNVSKKEMERAKEIFDEAEDCLIVASDKGCAIAGTAPELLTIFTFVVNKLRDNVPEEILGLAFRMGLPNIKSKTEIGKAKELLELLEKLEKLTKEM